MHDGMPYGRNQGQGQGHSRELDRQSPTGLIFKTEWELGGFFFISTGKHFLWGSEEDYAADPAWIQTGVADSLSCLALGRCMHYDLVTAGDIVRRCVSAGAQNWTV